MGIVEFSIIGCLITLVALGFFIGAVITYMRQSRQLAERASTQGEVVALERRVMRAGSSGVYCPVVKFRTTAGQEIQFESDFGTLPASHKVGQSVTVSYDPADPQKAEISSSLSRWLMPGILAFMGLIALCLGGSFLVFGLLMKAVSP